MFRTYKTLEEADTCNTLTTYRDFWEQDWMQLRLWLHMFLVQMIHHLLKQVPILNYTQNMHINNTFTIWREIISPLVDLASDYKDSPNFQTTPS